MVHELLPTGASNAMTGRTLADLLNCNIREVTIQIERERRQGQPICANAKGSNAGYFLAETPEELDAYCNQLLHRGGELFKTRGALLVVLDKMIDKMEQEQIDLPSDQEAAAGEEAQD